MVVTKAMHGNMMSRQGMLGRKVIKSRLIGVAHMNKQQAKAELKKIRKQKTVSVKRLNKILNVLDYEALEKGYINQAGKLKSMKNKDREIRRLRSEERRVGKERE